MTWWERAYLFEILRGLGITGGVFLANMWRWVTFRKGALTGSSDGAERTLIVTADPSRCLLVYPRATWEPIQARLMALSSFNEEIRGLQRLLVGHADEVDMDGAGRVLVPPALRQYAGLDHRVVLVGQGSKFELWDDAKWREQTARAITFPAGGLPPELDGFSL